MNFVFRNRRPFSLNVENQRRKDEFLRGLETPIAD